jgi:hypothetical protein
MSENDLNTSHTNTDDERICSFYRQRVSVALQRVQVAFYLESRSCDSRRGCHQKREDLQILSCHDRLSNSLHLHKHTNAHYLRRNHLTQDRTTKTKPQSLPLVPELLVILTKWMSRTSLLLQCIFLRSCGTYTKTES